MPLLQTPVLLLLSVVHERPQTLYDLPSPPRALCFSFAGFTYRRTQQRHISVAPKWTKRKKGEEAKDDDDEPSPQRAKRKYTKRKQDGACFLCRHPPDSIADFLDPLKNKRLNVNTNGEEMEDYNPSDDSGEVCFYFPRHQPKFPY